MKLLRAIVLNCPRCHGTTRFRAHPCAQCGGKGCFIIDRSFERTEPVSVPVRLPKVYQHDNKSYTERRADDHCGDCGSPNLETEVRCAGCAENHREAMRRIRRRESEL